MKLNGIDFWSNNRHLLTMWDDYHGIGPVFTAISDHVRVGKSFSIYLSNKIKGLGDLLLAQNENKMECTIRINVIHSDTKKEMYEVELKATLKGIKMEGLNSDPYCHLTYCCNEAHDKTNYDALQEVPQQDLHYSDSAS